MFLMLSVYACSHSFVETLDSISITNIVSEDLTYHGWCVVVIEEMNVVAHNNMKNLV